ncbi:uncharacterized protein FOMMEDRAFT_148220 [Fomitiporia mediterranea MF3/22]|uniref:uncharacterized protein n=1 Tax=Fomitiporia mediterranea (strain MF3/22) TaxID=694068 RepID=UPI0004408099|nr:uncharacterized protein FOMMEDRAFT_148220 [Fomitiporia mediterranea MF3/22]EJD00420.1 hypothetical protein FOMMEDRAFT_148220 [Fomitiporia mediterranea MF3/22]
MNIPFFPPPSALPATGASDPALDPFSTSASARLPVELWRMIFVFATRVVGGYDTSYASPFDVSDITNGYGVFLKELKASHRTKETLCLVSRSWRKLARELIFEYLFLQDSYDWAMLAEALEESRQADAARRGHGAGWYVRRIEINTQCWTQEKGVAAARVIRCCPNLRVLTVGAFEEIGSVPMELITAIFESCPHAIRSLDWTCDIGPEQMIEMFCRMPITANLQSLFMCVQQDITLGQLSKLKAAGPISLPHLHTIELVSPDFDPSVILTLMADFDLPSLRQIVLCGQDDLADAHLFFTAHGPKLTTLEFDFAGEPNVESPTTIPPPTYPTSDNLPERGPEMLLTRCPNLKELVLQVHWASEQALPGHPQIERIGIRGLYFIGETRPRTTEAALVLRSECDAEQRHIVNSLRTAFPVLVNRKLYPKVKAVRLLDFDQSRFRSVPWRTSRVAFWAFWIRRFERLGIRLEDHAGELIELVFREVNVLLPEDEDPSICCG